MEYQLTLNWPDFLERHWQKRPVVLKRGFNNFIDPLSPDELAGLAMESEVDSRLVSHGTVNGRLATVRSKAMIISARTTGRCWYRRSITGMNPPPR